ncbi:MAG: 4-carboxymuconolactone decarboxylase [Minwuia sp.]|nr:4-carboxymuconolactone decarboxylase [Minwuia sp.]
MADDPLKNADRYAAGMEVRRKVLGDTHVDSARASATDLDGEFQDFITETAWGGLWTRPHFSLRERSLVTLSILAALGRDGELTLHAKATRNTGATMEDVREAMLHVAVYAGVPAANHAIKLIKQVYAEIDTEAGEGHQ